MSETWNTKFGSRRVKQALPTIEEALFAAECLNDDFDQQVEIAASLLGVGVEEVRAVAKRSVKPVERRLSLPIAKSPVRLSRRAPWWSNIVRPSAWSACAEAPAASHP